MMRTITYIAAAAIGLHGLIHLMGFVAYWPLADVAALPYRTALLGGRWPVGAAGMRLFAALWLATSVALVGAAAGLAAGRGWWLPATGAAVLLSLVLCVLDWSNAFRGAVINLVLLVPLLLGWGLRLSPAPFPPLPAQGPPRTTMPLPPDLPEPVARFYRTTMGEGAPVVATADITGRGSLRFAGITFPARVRFTHHAGQGYRHDIEATLFGLPLLKVDEQYRHGRARLRLPAGLVENEPKVDRAANLSLWGESVWLPSIYLTDPRVRWEAVDAVTARLIVPFASEEESFTVHFDPGTGLVRRLEALRYREAADEEKIPWLLDMLAWDTYQGVLLPSRSTVTWADEGAPWLVIELDDVIYNVALDDVFRVTGP